MSLKKKEIIEIIVIAVCAVILIAALIGRISGSRGARSNTAETPKLFSDQVAGEIQKEKMDLYESLQERSASLEVIRDPFFKVTYPYDPKTRGLNLSGIMWDEDMPLAIINDQVVTAGEAVNGRIIVEVNQYSVKVHDIDGKVFELEHEQFEEEPKE